MTYFNDLEPTCRERVEEQGYLVPEKLNLDSVIPSSEDTNFVPEWEHVIALINRASTQSRYNTIILYDDLRLIKIRPTANKLIKQLNDHFPLDYHNDMRCTIAKALNINRYVPYICRDFWLVPVTKRDATNRSWFRWQYKSDIWDFGEIHSRVIVDKHLTLQWPLSRRAVESHHKRCKQIASYLKQQAALICPTFDMADLGQYHTPEAVEELMKKIEKYKRGLILGEAGFQKFIDEVDDDLNHNRYWQLPDTEF